VSKDGKGVEEIVITRLLRVSAAVHGIVTGLVGGLGIFIMTNWLVLKGGPVVGPHLGLLGQFFIGYRVTFTGSLMAAGKLQEVRWIPQRPVTYPGQNFVNIGVLAIAIGRPRVRGGLPDRVALQSAARPQKGPRKRLAVTDA